MESDRKVKEKSEKEENLGKIPFYATIYHPKGKQLVDELLGKHTRRIFDIPLEEYTDFEKQKLIEFYEYCISQKYIIPERNKSGKYSYPNIFRQLQGSDFDIEKGFKEITHEITFKNEKLPMEINDDFKNIINSGFLYVHGRDKYYRPLVIFNPGVFSSINCSVENWKKFGVFFMEFLVNECLLPSKVENWNIIVDLGSLQMSNIPYQLKDIFSAFKGIYRCRLYKLYLLNMNFVFSIVWSAVKLLMGPTLEAKACKVETNDGQYDLLFKLINRNQVEKKYGGTAEDLKQGEYYPPKFISDNYFAEEDDEKNEKIDENVDYLKDNDSNMVFYEARSD
jgi:hypothetical protein